MSKQQYITLKQAESEKSSSLWAVNTTKPRGVLNISMPDGLGGTSVMIIPITWVPIDLTTQATKENLIKSPVFRRMVANGAISLMSEEVATEIMEGAEAQKEAKRVYSAVTGNDELGGNNTNAEVEKLTKEDSGKIAGFALNVVNLELDEDQILNMVRGQEGVLEKADYQYIAENSPMERVKKYAASKAVEE